ncbi:MAG TPA: hypothetical protein VKW08_15215 [Xanthobacteraceae bacterium]|nr:hypothetical protein [Xanthobacteraceae bacterium]
MRYRFMRRQFVAVVCAAIIGVVAASAPALAQQKTVKACQDEWRANKDANQAAGVTEKAYVDKCRAGGSATAPAPSQAAAPAAAPAAAAPATKTVKACQDEWRANKDAYQAGGVTEKAYVDKCRAGQTVAIPGTPAPGTPTASAPPAATAPAAKPGGTSAAAPPPARSAPTNAPRPATSGNEFTAEAQAKAHCPTDTVVWANLDTKVYHFSGTRNYGTTKEGAYMCERDALAQGVRAAKNEKHP